MSEKREQAGCGPRGHAHLRSGGRAGPACDVPLPTELGDAIDEAIEVQAREVPQVTPSAWIQTAHDTYLAKWFVTDPAPLVFVDDVRVGRYEDLPAVRLWSESGLRSARTGRPRRGDR